MIVKSQMLPLLINACPSFSPTWQEMNIERGQDEPLVYIELGEFARHLVKLYLQGQTAEFAEVFDLVERFHLAGDDYVQNAAVIGLLEDIQNIAGNRKIDQEVFVRYLKPISVAWWQSLNRFWSGQSASVVLPDTGAA